MSAMRSVAYTPAAAMGASRRWLFGSMLALLAVGLVMAYSAGAVRQMQRGTDLDYLQLQLLQIGVALCGFLVASRIRPRHLYALARPTWIAAVVLLIMVLVVGPVRNNAQRWLSLGGISFQPSEFARLATIVMVGAWMAHARDRVTEVGHGLLVPFALAAVPAALVLLEPDLGSSVFLLFMGVLVLWVGGARVVHLGAAFLVTMSAVALYGWARLEHPLKRLQGFADLDPSSQVGQGLMALGHGGVLGTGLGGSVAKWGFLPEAESDFVLAVVGEELGLLGTALIVALYALFLGHGVRLLLGLRTRFGLVVGVGLLMQVVVQALLNVAVVTAAVPPKGVPLPFISSGGTSRLILCISAGLLLGLARHPEEDPVQPARWASSLTRKGAHPG